MNQVSHRMKFLVNDGSSQVNSPVSRTPRVDNRSAVQQPPIWPILYNNEASGLKKSTQKEFNLDSKEIASI